MSLIHADNFNIYGPGTSSAFMLQGRYSDAECGIVTDPDGVSTTKVIQFNALATLRRALKVPDNKIGVGMRIWLSSLPSDDSIDPFPVVWRDAANANMFYFRINTTGSISAYVWDTTSGAFGAPFLVGTTTGPVVTAGAWWHLEAVFDGDALTFELRVEGVTVLEADSTDFAGHLHNGPNVYQVAYRSNQAFGGFSINTYVKDYFMWDSRGTQNIDFLGACLVAELRPEADVDIGGWVPSTGADAWSILDNQPASSPFVSASLPLPVDALVMSQTDMPEDISSIKGIVTVVRAAKVDGGDGQLQVSLISGSDESNGTDRPITASQTYWEDVHELDPATDAAWTVTAVDNSNIKIDRTV